MVSSRRRGAEHGEIVGAVVRRRRRSPARAYGVPDTTSRSSAGVRGQYENGAPALTF